MLRHTLIDPITSKKLRFICIDASQQSGYLTADDNGMKWPVMLGISFLKVSQAELAQKTVDLLLNNKPNEALAGLLQDTDDFAKNKPLWTECLTIADHLLNKNKNFDALTFMQRLNYGLVAQYFAIRGFTPTFLSGIGLLKVGIHTNLPLVEIGCGVGHFLYWLKQRKIDSVGVDTVFSKLCIAKLHMDIDAHYLICAEVGRSSALPFTFTSAVDVFCHDVFYFIKDKYAALKDFRRLTQSLGNILIGHAHLSSADHGIVSGYPLTIDGYHSLTTKQSLFFDDTVFIHATTVRDLDRTIPNDAEAISFIEGTLPSQTQQWWNLENETLFLPLQIDWSANNQHTVVRWPNQNFEKEYANAKYLVTTINPHHLLPFKGNINTLGLHESLAIPKPFLTLGVAPIKWGVIGVGWISEDYFIPSFEYVPHASLVAISDINIERFSSFQSLQNIKFFADWRVMLADCALDAIYIATPNHLHAEICQVAAQLGIYVLCEKPLCTNLKDLNTIKRAVEGREDKFQTAFDQRYHPAHLRLVDQIGKGVLGQVTQIKIHYACWLDSGWKKNDASENWRINVSKAGGGAGFDLLPHCIDLALLLIDDSIDSAHLYYQKLVHDYAIAGDVDDGALMSIKTMKGVLISIHVGYHCPEHIERRKIEIIGSQGRVDAINTLGQDPGGHLTWHIDHEKIIETFSTGVEAGPFVKQLDILSRLWLSDKPSPFSFVHDIALAESLIHCDIELNK